MGSRVEATEMFMTLVVTEHEKNNCCFDRRRNESWVVRVAKSG